MEVRFGASLIVLAAQFETAGGAAMWQAPRWPGRVAVKERPAVKLEELTEVPFVAPWERRIILCRHGHVAREAADLQENAFYGGNFDVPLSAGGDADMRAVAEYIASQHYSEAAATVFASPTAAVSGSLLQRALAPRAVGGVRLVQSDLLAEVDRGRWANLTAAEVRRRWGDDSYERWALDDDYGARECGGEGMGDLRARALAVRDLVLERTLPGTASVICTHLWVARQILADAVGVEDGGLCIDVPYASISLLDFPDTAWPSTRANRDLPYVRLLGCVPADAAGDAVGMHRKGR